MINAQKIKINFTRQVFLNVFLVLALFLIILQNFLLTKTIKEIRLVQKIGNTGAKAEEINKLDQIEEFVLNNSNRIIAINEDVAEIKSRTSDFTSELRDLNSSLYDVTLTISRTCK